MTGPDTAHAPRRRATDIPGVLAVGENVILTPPKPYDHVRAHPFEAYIGVVSIIRALRFFFDPSALAQSPLGHALRPYDQVWNALSLLGGICILIGLAVDHRIFWRGRIQGIAIECGGLIFASFAVVLNAIAIIDELGFTPQSFVTSSTLLLLLIPFSLRFKALWSRSRTHVPVPVYGRPQRRHPRAGA